MSNIESIANSTEDNEANSEAKTSDDIIAEALAEAADWKDKCLRTAAEMENLRKRTERDVAETQKYAVSNFARDLINVAENLKRALDSISEDELANASDLLKNIHYGVDMTLKELLGTFENFGLKRIDPIGEKFDHNLHQAIAQVEAPNSETGTIVQVVQAGYTIHDRLLRPAMVAVAKTDAPQKPSVDTIA